MQLILFYSAGLLSPPMIIHSRVDLPTQSILLCSVGLLSPSTVIHCRVDLPTQLIYQLYFAADSYCKVDAVDTPVAEI